MSSAYKDWLKRNWRTIGLAVTASLVLLAAAALLELRYPGETHWWSQYVALVLREVSAFLVAGLLGILLFDATMRVAFIHHIVEWMRDLFLERRELAMVLDPGRREKFVQKILQAQVGERLGDAIFHNIAKQYITPGRYYRSRFLLDVTLSPLDRATSLGGPAPTVLQPADYDRLEIGCCFEAPWNPRHAALAFTLRDDFGELQRFFADQRCVYRDNVYLLPETAAALAGYDLDTARTAWSELVKIEMVVNHSPLSALSYTFPPGRSRDTILVKPGGASVPGETTEHVPQEIKIHTFIAKNVTQYPAVIAYPSMSPLLKFRWPSDVQEPSVYPYLYDGESVCRASREGSGVAADYHQPFFRRF